MFSSIRIFVSTCTLLQNSVTEGCDVWIIYSTETDGGMFSYTLTRILLNIIETLSSVEKHPFSSIFPLNNLQM